MTQVKKPGSHGKIASVLFVFRLKNLNGLSSTLYQFSKNSSRYSSNQKKKKKKKKKEVGVE